MKHTQAFPAVRIAPVCRMSRRSRGWCRSNLSTFEKLGEPPFQEGRWFSIPDPTRRDWAREERAWINGGKLTRSVGQKYIVLLSILTSDSESEANTWVGTLVFLEFQVHDV